MRWIPIKDFEAYEVSDTGIVRRRIASHMTPVGFVLKQKTCPKGYKKVCLSKPGIQQWFLVHRLVCLAFLGSPPPKRPHVAHFDGNPSNNNLENLRWASPAENNDDQRRHGTMPYGDRSGSSKLNWDIVRSIRNAKKYKGYIRDLSRKHGVRHSTICRIVNNQAWPEQSL